MSNFIDNMESLMDLFIKVHGRKPSNYKEFEGFIASKAANSHTLNSRKEIK